jgi:paraquat-inducible protein A
LQTAKDAFLGQCRRCQRLLPITKKKHLCPRCGASVYLRKPKSLERSLAFTLAGLIAFIPANFYPIMVIYSLGNAEASTTLEGVQAFIKLGMYPVAIIVFIASFLVPLSKILGLLILLTSVRQNSKIQPQQRTKLYHFIEFLGPWSMLDIFVVAIMAAVVNLGFLTTIEAGVGATFFTTMVLCTMLAAENFDPRLIWDKQNHE